MEADTVTISKEEYARLKKCERIVQEEFELMPSEKLLESIKKSEEYIKEGRFSRFNNKEEVKKFLDSL